MSAPRDGLVSVVMIFRDAAEFFDEAVDSVLAQTGAPVELLLCDDGSTDGSSDTARARARDDPAHVRYLEHPGHAHRGMSATRNLGVAAASGELVAFLDADDVWRPGHLAHEVTLLLAHPEAGMVCGRATMWRSWSEPGVPDPLSPLPWPPGTVVPPPRMLLAVLSRGAFATPTCSLLVRRRHLREAGGSEDRFTTMYEDQVLLTKLYLALTGVISDASSAMYRQHPRSSSAVAIRDGSYDPFLPNASEESFLRWVAAHLSARRGPDLDEVRALLAARLHRYDDHPQLPSWSARARRLAQRLGGLPGRHGRRRRRVTEQFLAAHRHLLSGRILAAAAEEHVARLGGPRVTRVRSLRTDELRPAGGLDADGFDCVVVTRPLGVSGDAVATTRELHRVLLPGGTLLLAAPVPPTWAEAVLQVFGAGNVEVTTVPGSGRGDGAGRPLVQVRGYRPSSEAVPLPG